MSQPAARSPSFFSRLRLSRLGWRQRALIIVAALIGSGVFAYGANLASRKALLQVVRGCVLDKSMLGSPLPCLQVDLDDGYVVLRPPFGEPDTILAPTHPIAGIEAPELQAADEPNYFALAWEARKWLTPASGAAPSEDRVGLAVNSRLSRAQDQLHIHIGCLSQSFRDRLAALPAATRVWTRGADMAPGLELWSYRSGGKDWRDLEPFRLVKSLIGEPKALARTTLAVVAPQGELVVVALRSRPGGWYAAAEDVIDARC